MGGVITLESSVGELVTTGVAGIEDVQQFLPKGTVLLEYALGDTSSLLWAVVAAYEEPVKFRPSSVRQDHGEVAPSDPREFTADQWTAHVEEVKRDDRARARALRKAGKGKKMRSHWTKNR